MQELALENKLPYVQLVESAGANLMHVQASRNSCAAADLFRNLARHVGRRACRWSR